MYEYGPYVNITSVDCLVTDGINERDTLKGTFEEIVINDDTNY
jgi:hypothetical protein